MGDTVMLWHGCLQGTADDSVLSETEKCRAASIKRAEVRQQFVAMRTRVRQILAGYIGCKPAELVIGYTEFGKPWLPDFPELSFNLSHCDTYWVLALAAHSRIGVDLELIRPRKGMEGLVRRCFSAAEQAAWNGLTEDKERRFYQYWTAKEAFVKAVGRGIALGLEKVQVSFSPEPCLRHIPTECGSLKHWYLMSPAISDNQVVTLCLETSSAPTLQVRAYNADTD